MDRAPLARQRQSQQLALHVYEALKMLTKAEMEVGTESDEKGREGEGEVMRFER